MNEIKELPLLIIKIKFIREFNVYRLNLWIFSTKKSSTPHWHTLPCFHPFIHASLLVALSPWQVPCPNSSWSIGQ
jgi:hypothetical protein